MTHAMGQAAASAGDSAALTSLRLVHQCAFSMASGESTASRIAEAAHLIRGARQLTAFTGAGISLESGIPPFRGEGGLWSKYDPRLLEIRFFRAHPDRSWPLLKDIFYGSGLRQARPNRAHEVLAAWEARGPTRDTRRSPARSGQEPRHG